MESLMELELLERQSLEKEFVEKHNRALSIITHDLKSPMIAILGFTELLRRKIQSDSPNPEWLGMLDRIGKAGRDVEKLIENILSMAKMEAGKEKIEVEWVWDLATDLKEVERTFEAEAKAKGIALTLNIVPPLPVVRWDITRIRYHVLNNLVSNALKFTPTGGAVAIEARAYREGVILNVRDTGPGIKEEDKERIFERFEQMDSQSARVSKGAGLGLHNAQLFVTRHGGNIFLESSEEKGANFVIELPFDAIAQRSETRLIAA